jgi:hypothetical protein
MLELKRFAWFAAALVLVFTGSAAAGIFENSSVSLDLNIESVDADEVMIDDGNTDTTGVDITAGSRPEVEVFVSPMPGPLTALALKFDLDTDVITLRRFRSEAEDAWVDNIDPPGFIPLAAKEDDGLVESSYATGEDISSIEHFGYTLPNGYAGTAQFDMVVDGTDPLVIGLEFFALTDTSSEGAASDTVTIAPALTVSAEELALGESATVSLVDYVVPVTINGTTDQIEWAVATTGAAAVAVEGQSGLTFTTAPSVRSLVLNSSGSGAVTADVTATIGSTVLTAASIVFQEAVPVELAAFGGELVEEQVVLNWTTASQTNNAGWRVLRSVDGENFEAVGDFVSGAGTSDALLSYAFTDGELPTTDAVFYVLEQLDLDGTVHLSSPVEILLGSRFDIPTEYAIGAYPNPFNPTTTINYDLPNNEQVSIVIYDVLGQEVRRLVDQTMTAGRYTARWDARDNLGRSVGSGVYIAKIEAGTFSQSQKMLLLK